MTCPLPIARLLLEVIRAGVLRARAASWAGDIKRCEAETDHIHNLPGLVLDFRPDLLRCMLGSESWNWQFRGDPSPAVHLRQTWERVR